jgi:hypothetical protein
LVGANIAVMVASGVGKTNGVGVAINGREQAVPINNIAASQTHIVVDRIFIVPPVYVF